MKFDIFSKRQARLRGETPDCYSYGELPDALRAQIVHIWFDTLGNPDQYHSHHYTSANCQRAYRSIVDALCREYGQFSLSKEVQYGSRDYLKELVKFLMNEGSVERCLDVVELSFLFIERRTNADDAILELNSRFKEHGVGYQFVSGEIVRIDSEFLHAQTVVPALTLLNTRSYEGAQDEFLKAHEHYRQKNYKEALSECLKSLESTIKTIHQKRKWTYDPKSTIKPLIQACFDNGLVPEFWSQHFSSLLSAQIGRLCLSIP